MAEVCQLIKDSPSNLRSFFDNAYHIVEGIHIPKTGHIRGQPLQKSLQSVEGERIPMAFWFTNKETLTTAEFEEHFLYIDHHHDHAHDDHDHSHEFLQRLRLHRTIGSKFKGHDELPIVLKKINFKYDFETGSVNSIRFHQALRDCKEDDVFSSEVIQIILRYKWRKMTFYRNFRIFMLVVYIILLITKSYGESKIYKATHTKDRSLIIFTGDIIFGIYFMVMEITTVIGKWDLNGFKWSLIARFYFPLTIILYLILDY